MTPRPPKTHQVSQYRCVVSRDAGWTRGESARSSYCCMYFARGICHKGKDCEYLHQLPTEYHEQLLTSDHTVDIFGRDKLPGSHTGTKGVGTYDRESKTLYVNYGGAGHLGAPVIRQLVQDNFDEWGPIERIYNVASKTIAFVQFYWRASAEFAKEAMQNQHLKGSDMASSDTLDVRWANDDPNPKAVRRVKRQYEEEYMSAVREAVNELPPEQKRARLLEMQLYGNAAIQPNSAVAPYPDTTQQYNEGFSHDPNLAVAPYPDTQDQFHSGVTAQGGPAEMYPSTTEQFHENGYFADPQTINELAQYWEDQRNIDSLLGHVQEQHSTDESSIPGTMPRDGQQGPLESELEPGQQPMLQKSPKVTDANRVNRERSAADETKFNPLSGLVNYESSDAES
ncbi:hypothetical protein ABBQ38_001957 [Trebouxia sp. C0009 RCD-2024]